jgi:alpha-amylase
MALVSLYLQIHQPYRLRHYTVFDSASDYFATPANAAIIRQVAERCYGPALAILLKSVQRHRRHFRFALGITGTALEQLEAHAPAVVATLRELVDRGCVEVVGETYYHSLAFVYSRAEFAAQVELHRAAVRRLLGAEPTTFRNTEMIYNDAVAEAAADLGFATVLSEGWEAVLGPHRPTQVFTPPGGRVTLLLRHYALSDDIAFRFGRPDWPEWPLTAAKFAQRIGAATPGADDLCNIFLDFETFGEHQPAGGGILEFLEALPRQVLKAKHTFVTPAEIAARNQPRIEISVAQLISWADRARDVSAWLGNAMQASALQELYRLEAAVKRSDDAGLLQDWRRLTTSDHAYYMSTKYLDDGAVHAHFSPYESPYDAYINFMNVLDNLRARLR